MGHRIGLSYRAARITPIIALLAACASSQRTPANDAAPAATPALTPAEVARRDGGIPPYTRADVEFMQGMIGHHAQAIVMARLAPSSGASNAIRILAERIAVSQEDEIHFMQSWLRKRNERVPLPNVDVAPEHFHHASDHDMMPGMLTPVQMDSLTKARGTDFDKLFLRFMIQHHDGALTMLEKLFGTPGAGQDAEVFRFASDVSADQTTEIERMQLMLDEMSKNDRELSLLHTFPTTS